MEAIGWYAPWSKTFHFMPGKGPADLHPWVLDPDEEEARLEKEANDDIDGVIC